MEGFGPIKAQRCIFAVTFVGDIVCSNGHCPAVFHIANVAIYNRISALDTFSMAKVTVCIPVTGVLSLQQY